ncbi:armadillo-type protein [Chytridium lagenaria]|nr:armadillo-type protein [Chytridium lagenaria]
MVAAELTEYDVLESTLLGIPQEGSKRVPLQSRFRALFALKNINDQRSIDIICKAFVDQSALLKHELAYVLGQMKNPYAIPQLIGVLGDTAQDPMVRHEAAEALGAIGDESSLETLKKYLNDPEECRVVKETCEIAIDKIQFESSKQKDVGVDKSLCSVYNSIDPAPPMPQQSRKVEDLEQVLLDESLPLFERYRAMFALRNRGDESSVQALARGFNDESALFRHEIAFVFGQMQHPSSVPALIQVLADTNEAGMVRHECAEALGSIATKECYDVLQNFLNDPEQVVRESCIVGLDIYDNEVSDEVQTVSGLC